MTNPDSDFNQAPPAKKTVGYLVYENFLLNHVAGPMAAFEMAGHFDSPIYTQLALSLRGGLVSASSGVALATLPTADAPVIDILIIAGGFGAILVEQNETFVDVIRQHALRGTRIAAIASASGILARTGLLAGRQATSHWSLRTELERMHPEITVLQDALVTNDGPFWTCAISTGAVEIARLMIEQDFGPSVARRATRDLIPADRRVFATMRDRTEDHVRYEQLLVWARANLRLPLTVQELAERHGATERRFLAAFVAHMGETPAKVIERLRVEAASHLIETSDQPLVEIAHEVGFRQPERMRRAFIRNFGQSPQAMRMAFKHRTAMRR